MNRIKISPLVAYPKTTKTLGPQPPISLSPADKSSTSTQKKPLLDSDSVFARRESPDSTDSSLFLPLHYEKNYEYPLLVWLHNNGDDPNQVQRVMPQLSLRNFVAVAPQAALGDHHCGFYWDQDPSSIDYSTDAVLDAIDLAKLRTNINRRRIFVAGFGAAGTMAFRVALTHPDLFAGVASINGPLPEGSAPLGRWSSSRNLEVFWSHCRKSEEFKQAQLCQQLKLLHVAGFSVTLRQYPGADDLTSSALSDLNSWIMQMFSSTIA